MANPSETFPPDPRLTSIPEPCTVVLFGISGSLAHAKTLPTLYDLANRGLLPAGFKLIGVARRDWTVADLRREAHAAIGSGARTPFRQQVWEELAESLVYVQGDATDPATFDRLAQVLAATEAELPGTRHRVFCLDLPPNRVEQCCHGIVQAGLARLGLDRVVLERPFGVGSAGAHQLDDLLDRSFAPPAVYRMDPYLSSELVRHLLALRHANALFEAVWSAQYVDHVQITLAEDQGVGARTGYYNSVGAMRDLVSTHLLQLLALTAMEPPQSMAPDHVAAAKLEALEAVRLAGPVDLAAVRGQYGAGWQGNLQVPGYLDEPGIGPDSTTETFAALKLAVETPRWEGVPFYLRTGKRLNRRVTDITLVLKPSPWLASPEVDTGSAGVNLLVLRIRPDAGLTIRLGTKVPNTQTELRSVAVDFSHGHSFAEAVPESFEQEFSDVLLGARAYFPSSPELAEAWRVTEPVLAAWRSQGGHPETYKPGSWGPSGAQRLVEQDNRRWRRQ